MFILEDIKNYLNGRARAEQILKLTDKELEKYVNLALTILETYYKIDELLVPETRNTIIAEETLFVFKNNTDFEKFYEYYKNASKYDKYCPCTVARRMFGREPNAPKERMVFIKKIFAGFSSSPLAPYVMRLSTLIIAYGAGDC